MCPGYMDLKYVIAIAACLLLLFIVFKRRRSWLRQKRIESNKEIHRYNSVLRKDDKTVEDVYYLAQKNFRGIPEVVHKKTVLPGMKPNFRQAAYFYERLLGTPYHYLALVSLGDIHNFEYSDDNTLINRSLAREYYTQATYSPNAEIRMEATEKLARMNDDDGILDAVIDGDDANNLPPDPLPNIPQPVEMSGIQNDSQNVHDSGVVNSIKIIIRDLAANTKMACDKNECIASIHGVIKNYGSNPTVRDRALKTFKRMCESNTLISSVDMNETDLMRLVWNRICSLSGQDRKNVEENLVLQLSEGIEHGDVVCAQGRFNHLLSCLDVLNLESVDPHVKPLWAIRKEMQYKASTMYGQIDNDILKENLKKEFKKEYVEKGLVTDKFIDAEVDSWDI